MYREISEFAPNLNNDLTKDPLFYCSLDSMNSQFLHGSQGRIFGRYNESCAHYMSKRCSENWDELCEVLSQDQEKRFPNTINPFSSYENNITREPCLSYGEQLIRNSAFKKYKVQTNMCNIVCKPHDPTVANSPLICYESKIAGSTGEKNYEIMLNNIEAGFCDRIYKILPQQLKDLDSDPIMNHILDEPKIASDLLEKIYYQMKSDRSLYTLKNTRLGNYYEHLGHELI